MLDSARCLESPWRVSMWIFSLQLDEPFAQNRLNARSKRCRGRDWRRTWHVTLDRFEHELGGRWIQLKRTHLINTELIRSRTHTHTCTHAQPQTAVMNVLPACWHTAGLVALLCPTEVWAGVANPTRINLLQSQQQRRGLKREWTKKKKRKKKSGKSRSEPVGTRTSCGLTQPHFLDLNAKIFDQQSADDETGRTAPNPL